MSIEEFGQSLRRVIVGKVRATLIQLLLFPLPYCFLPRETLPDFQQPARVVSAGLDLQASPRLRLAVQGVYAQVGRRFNLGQRQ